MAGHEAELLRRLVPRLLPGGVPRYLDFACGTGRILSLVRPMAETALGIDVSPSMIARARRKCPDSQFLLWDVSRYPLEIEQFQLISAFRFLGRAQPELRASALRGLYHLLAPGGYLIVNNHRNPWSVRHLLAKKSGRAGHADLSPPRLQGLLMETGFSVLDSYGVGFWVVRARFDVPRVLRSPMARRLEPLSRLPFLRPLCPDLIVVAQKPAGADA